MAKPKSRSSSARRYSRRDMVAAELRLIGSRSVRTSLIPGALVAKSPAYLPRFTSVYKPKAVPAKRFSRLNVRREPVWKSLLSRPVRPNVVRKNLVAASMSQRVRVCLARTARKGVLFALKKAGFSGSAPGRKGSYLRTMFSSWSCK